jgi:hypothetical protein
MSNHTLPPTKRQRIRELILAEAKLNDIIDEVGTTQEYVYKERGRMKREGLLVTHQSLSISKGKREITVVKDQPLLVENIELHRPKTIDRVNDYDIPPLNKNDLKAMYEDFENQKGPAEVTAKRGIHPQITLKEFERFLKMKSRDPYDLQKRLTDGIPNSSPEIQSIVDKSLSTLLTNDEIMSIFNHQKWTFAYSYVRDTVLNPTQYPPLGLHKIVCRTCHKQLPGVIYSRNTYAGLHTQQIVGLFMCDTCRAIQQHLVLPK